MAMVVRLSFLGLFLLVLVGRVYGNEWDDNDFFIKGQFSSMYQHKSRFNAAYSGVNSINAQEEGSRSNTATLYVGKRLWKGAEFYFNEEAVTGVPFGGALNGVGAVYNTELQKGSSPSPIFYEPRIFVRQTLNFSGQSVQQEAGLNNFSDTVSSRRMVVTVGKIALMDIFDQNRYAHDGRSDFMNWTAVAMGAYDYAADVRGYTWGAAIEYYHDDCVVRYGQFSVPKESNGLDLAMDFKDYSGTQLELEHRHFVGNQEGKIRLLTYRNVENLGRFDDALVYQASNGGVVDVGNVRHKQAKLGYGVNVEQAINDNVGIFGRFSQNDGHAEMFSYTEVDRSTQLGLSMAGSSWGRSKDRLGISWVQNELSAAHQAYHAAGGVGFLLGDGKLDHYLPECLWEVFYRYQLGDKTHLSADVQQINNPAYNADRGPMIVYGMRLHIEF